MAFANSCISIGESLSSRLLVGRGILIRFSVAIKTKNTSSSVCITDNPSTFGPMEKEEEKWTPTEHTLGVLYDASIGAKLTKDDRNELYALYLYLKYKDEEN